MSEIISAAIRWAVPFICGGVIAGCITYVRTIHKRSNAERDGLQCLLRAEIIRIYDKYMALEYCPIYVKEALRRAYVAYHNLGGNDVATGLYNEVMELPTEVLKR